MLRGDPTTVPRLHLFAVIGHRFLFSFWQLYMRELLQVVAMLRGEAPLPWEDMEPAVVRKLGAFKGLVLQLLQRNPRRRVSLRHFHHTCTRLFDSRTTIEA